MKCTKKIRCVLLTAVSVVVAATFGVLFFVNDGSNASECSKVVEKEKKKRKIKRKVGETTRKVRRRRIHAQSTNEVIGVAMRMDSRGKPALNVSNDEEANLSNEYRNLLAAVREALDKEDRLALIRLVQKMQANSKWASEVPSLVKNAMLEALGWFGAACLPEVVGFMSDSNEEIAQSAFEKYEEAMADYDLSDRERSRLLVLASQVITDSDAMDSLLFELNNMRNSVAIDTIKQLMAYGGTATQTLLPENIELVTGEEGLNTPEKLDEWLTANPDDEADEEFYGGVSAGKQ